MFSPSMLHFWLSPKKSEAQKGLYNISRFAHWFEGTTQTCFSKEQVTSKLTPLVYLQAAGAAFGISTGDTQGHAEAWSHPQNSLLARLPVLESAVAAGATKIVVAAPPPAMQSPSAAGGQWCNSEESALGLGDPSLMPTTSCATLVKYYELGFTKPGLMKPCRP